MSPHVFKLRPRYDVKSLNVWLKNFLNFERICFWHKSSPKHKEIHQQLFHSPVSTELKIINYVILLERRPDGQLFIKTISTYIFEIKTKTRQNKIHTVHIFHTSHNNPESGIVNQVCGLFSAVFKCIRTALTSSFNTFVYKMYFKAVYLSVNINFSCYIRFITTEDRGLLWARRNRRVRNNRRAREMDWCARSVAIRYETLADAKRTRGQK